MQTWSYVIWLSWAPLTLHFLSSSYMVLYGNHQGCSYSWFFAVSVLSWNVFPIDFQVASSFISFRSQIICHFLREAFAQPHNMKSPTCLVPPQLSVISLWFFPHGPFHCVIHLCNCLLSGSLSKMRPEALPLFPGPKTVLLHYRVQINICWMNEYISQKRRPCPTLFSPNVNPQKY
jgi:hypothetical protein